MRAALMTFYAKALLLVGIALLPLGGGCDESPQTKADRRIDQGLADARGGTAQEAFDATNKLAGEAQASEAGVATAKAAYGQAQLELGMDFLAQVDRERSDLMRVAGEIRQLGESLRLGNQTVERLNALEPKKELAKADEEIALASGGEGKAVWFAEGEMKLPTLSAADAEIKRLNEEIGKRTEQIKQLEAQQKAAATEADTLTAQSEQQQGAESVATFKKGSELRRKASDLAAAAQEARDALVPVQGQLAAVKAQRDAVAGAIEQFKAEKQLIEQSWRATKDLAAKQAEAGKRLYKPAGGGEGVSASPQGVGLEAKIKELDTLATLEAETAERAATYLTAADTTFEEAKQAAEKYVLKLSSRIAAPENRDRPELKAWKAMADLYNPMAFHVQSAKAKRMLGDLKATQTALFQVRADVAALVAPAMEKAVIDLPPQLKDAKSLSDKANEAYVEASDAYGKAVEAYKDLETAGSATTELKNHALIGRMLALYSWGQLDLAKGDEASAKKKIDEAIAFAKALATDTAVRLPPGLPAELAPAVATVAPPAPTSVPTSAPAEATGAPAAP